jgi:lipoprotein-releasing system permease protein
MKKRMYEWEMAWRYFVGHSIQKNTLVSFVSWISLVGVCLGVIGLVVTTSVVNGFQSKTKSRLITMDGLSHISAQFDSGTPPETFNHALGLVKHHPEVISAVTTVESRSIVRVKKTDAIYAAPVVGMNFDIANDWSVTKSRVDQATLALIGNAKFNTVLGVDLAKILRVSVGDEVTIYAHQDTPLGKGVREKGFKVVGILEKSGSYYEDGLMLIDKVDAYRFFREDGKSFIRINIKDVNETLSVKAELQKILNPAGYPVEYVFDTWMTKNEIFVAASKIEKVMLFIVFSMITMIVSFNLISSLTMTVKDKQADIAILKTLGATSKTIRKIFVIQGSIIGVAGTFLGVVLGTCLTYQLPDLVEWIEKTVGVPFISKGFYGFDRLPVDPRASEIGIIVAVSLGISLLATLYPSLRASQIQPAEVLKHE